MKNLNHDILMDILEELLPKSNVNEYRLKNANRKFKNFVLSGKETLLALREFTKHIDELTLYNRTFDCQILKKGGLRIQIPELWNSFINFGWEYAKSIRVCGSSPLLYISNIGKNKRLENISFEPSDFNDEYEDHEQFKNDIREIIKNIKVPYLNCITGYYYDFKEISKVGCNVKRLHPHNHFDVIEFLQLKNINVLDEMEIDSWCFEFEMINNISNVSDGFRNIKKLSFGNCQLSKNVDKLESIKLEHFGEIFPQLEELNLNLSTKIKNGLDKVTNIIDKFIKILDRFNQKFSVMINWQICYVTDDTSNIEGIFAPDSKIFPDFIRDGDDLKKTIVLSSNLTISLIILIRSVYETYSCSGSDGEKYVYHYDFEDSEDSCDI